MGIPVYVEQNIHPGNRNEHLLVLTFKTQSLGLLSRLEHEAHIKELITFAAAEDALSYPTSPHTLSKGGCITWAEVYTLRDNPDLQGFSVTCREDGRLVGFNNFHIYEGEVTTSHTVVLSSHRRRNIGAELMYMQHINLIEIGITQYYTDLVGGEVLFPKLGINPIPCPNREHPNRHLVVID